MHIRKRTLVVYIYPWVVLLLETTHVFSLLGMQSWKKPNEPISNHQRGFQVFEYK